MKKSIWFAGGCFWGMEALYRALPGVLDVTAGYANGVSPDRAFYEAVCSGMTGFRETVQVDYDPDRISLSHLLFAFFAVIDPETPNRQGPDVGSQYQSGVYWTKIADEAVLRPIAALEAAAHPVFAVEMNPLKTFYPAEDYHQRYLERNPRGYCHISPWKRAALAGYPFEAAAYTRPAAELLREWGSREKGEWTHAQHRELPACD